MEGSFYSQTDFDPQVEKRCFRGSVGTSNFIHKSPQINTHKYIVKNKKTTLLLQKCQIIRSSLELRFKGPFKICQWVFESSIGRECEW